MEKSEKFQSLADFLGIQDQESPSESTELALPPPTLSAKAFCREVLRSPEYRLSIYRRVILGELPAGVEQMLWDRAHGKTVEKVEVKDKTESLEDLTPEAVAEKLERVQRMLLLLQNARQAEPDESSAGSIH